MPDRSTPDCSTPDGPGGERPVLDRAELDRPGLDGPVMDRLSDKISSVNARLATMLIDARLALRGERVFGVEQVRAISQEVAEMAPVMAQAPELRLLRPELEGELDIYKAQLGDLHVTLQQVRLMLLAQRSQMEASRAQLAAIAQFASALQQTR